MLYIHTSNYLEKLKKQYSEVVKTPLKGVFQKETVIVQNAGMARWLSINMAEISGISANTEYLFPAEFMWRILRQISPDIPEHSQCAPETLRFHIYEELIQNHSDYPELSHYILKNNKNVNEEILTLEGDEKSIIDQFNTWELACQTSRLLDQYLFYRGEWINDWENNSPSSKTSNSLHSNNHSDHWQARLWNRCVKDKNLLHWLKLQHQFTKNIENFDTSLLSERMCFFSMSALSPGYIDVLAAISKKTDIHVFIINPCEDVYWGDIQSPKAYSKLSFEEQSYAEIGNPLLASLGKQGRDFIDKLLDIQDQGITDDYVNNSGVNSEESGNKREDLGFLHQKTSLLSQIQQDIYNLESPELMPAFDTKDDSIQLHSCHTAMREVEILYDQILAQLDTDENLAPSDIVVMMPDIEKYAPYIESIFSTAVPTTNKNSKTHKLPFSIADRDPQNIFKIVQALNKLLCLPDTRFDVEAVFELLEYDDIRSHFGLSLEELNYCRDLALSTNIRWGINAKSRLDSNLPNTEEHTWKYALDRMLLGYSISQSDGSEINHDQLFESKRNLQLLPYNEIEGSNALVLSKFKKFIDTVFSIDDWQKETHSLEKWTSKTTDLLQQISPENSDQERIFKVLADIQVNAKVAEFKQDLPYVVYQKILQQSLSEISASEKYLGYGITFCALVPMRSVPFKVVALMGMNDGEFPRADTRPSFDLMSKQSRKGDRSRREEDRYLFLESLLAARSKLIISFIGQSIKDNTELAPSILVSELLDTVCINTGIPSTNWITKHPLQAFSKRYFSSDLSNDKTLFSYASKYLKLNDETSESNKNSSLQFISNELPALAEKYKELNLDELITFFKNPSRAFLKTRFSIQTYNDDKELNIREPFELEAFKDRDLRKLLWNNFNNLDNESNEDQINKTLKDKELIARAKGLLPYGEIGNAIFSKQKRVMEVFDQELPEPEYYPDDYFTLHIGEFSLQCAIDNLSDSGRILKQVGKPYAGDYISAWVTHLCMNASNNARESLTLKQTRYYSPEIAFQLNPVNDSVSQLHKLLDYYWQGLHYPLPFFPKSSFALLSNNGKQSITDMSSKWNGNDLFTGEKDSFEHALLHRDLILDTEHQSDEFMLLSNDVFGQMFQSMTEL